MNHFENIILTARPASGKSELIDFLKGLSADDRLKRFHIGAFTEVDDFPWVWELGEHDDIRERLGQARIDTKNVGYGYVTHEPELVLTKFMTLKLNRLLVKEYLSNEAYYREHTLFIEFARGGPGGYRYTFDHLDPRVLERSVVLFLDNSFEESVRRNEARFQEKRKHSILAHKTPDEELCGIYRTHDWKALTGGAPHGAFAAQGMRIPFVSVVNEPEVTDPRSIAERFSPPLQKLWELHASR